MLTISKSPEVERFGEVVPSLFKNNRFSNNAAVAYSPLGKIVKDSLRILPEIDPSVKLLQYVVMPDHLHLLISVEDMMERTIGQIIAIWKAETRKRTGKKLFLPSFNDQILFSWRSLDCIYRYIRENPYRLLIRMRNPGFFHRFNDILICGERCSAYGNIQLLSNPFKDAVIIHRKDSQEKKADDKKAWLYTASNNGILVSPFISAAEKEIRAEADTLDSKIILITHEVFTERYKPSGHDFSQCAEGRLLIITLGLPPKTPLSRNICLRMNALAQSLTSHPSPPPPLAFHPPLPNNFLKDR